MEPERKIEKLLRAYAQKRRAEAGDAMKLHPANRRILHDEAASTLRRGTAAENGRRRLEPGGGGLFLLFVTVLRRRLVFVLPVIVIAFLAFMYLPALNSAKHEAQSIGAWNNLKEIGVAARRYAEDNKDVLPASLDDMTNELSTRRVLIDPTTGKPFVYAGAGKKLDELQSNTVLAYSLADAKSHAVLFADGRVETVTGARLTELTNQKPVEFALADKSGRERFAETPPAAPPVASAQPALAFSGEERTKTALAGNESKAGNLGVKVPSAGEPAKRQLELAESESGKSEPVATPGRIGAVGGSLSGVGQTRAVNGSISGKLPATENSDALARSGSFYQLAMQTNSGQLFLTTSQNFVQASVSSMQNLFKNSTAPAQATPVLQSFQVQQNGDVISVVDRDGSIYHGSVRPETAMVRNEPAAADTVAPPGALPQAQGKVRQAAENQQQAAQNYFFRVAGMNRTLQQNVVFTGNVEAVTNAITNFSGGNGFGGAGGGGGGGGGMPAQNNQRVSANQSSQQNFLSNSRIVGTAVIASTNQIEINAVPVTQ